MIETNYNRLCATPSDINEHLPTLREYASRCSIVTEMGVRWVVSTWALLMGRPSTMYSFDLDDPSIYGTSPNMIAAEAKKQSTEFIFSKANVLTLPFISPTDLLFIDTQHTYVQLSQELQKFEAFVQKYIILHDTATFGLVDEVYTGNPKTGLQLAVAEFIGRNRAWQVHKVYNNNNGLTILKRV